MREGKLLLNLNKATYVIYKDWYDGDVKKTTLVRGPYTVEKNAVKEFKELFKTMKDIYLIRYTVVADGLKELGGE